MATLTKSQLIALLQVSIETHGDGPVKSGCYANVTGKVKDVSPYDFFENGEMIVIMFNPEEDKCRE